MPAKYEPIGDLDLAEADTLEPTIVTAIRKMSSIENLLILLSPPIQAQAASRGRMAQA